MTDRSPSEIAGRREDLLDSWIRDQIAFFDKRCREYESKVEVAHRVWRACVYGALMIAMATTWLVLSHPAGIDVGTLEHIGLALIVLAMAYAALSHERIKFWGYEALIRRYRLQREVFARAEKTFEAARDRGDPDQVEEVLRALGLEALTENCSWLLLHKDRPLEVHPI